MPLSQERTAFPFIHANARLIPARQSAHRSEIGDILAQQARNHAGLVTRRHTSLALTSWRRQARFALPALCELIVVAGAAVAVTVIDAGVARRVTEVAVPATVTAAARHFRGTGVTMRIRAAQRGAQTEAQLVEQAR